VTGQSVPLVPQGTETSLNPTRALFSPDGSKILVAISATTKRGVKSYYAIVESAGSKAPVRLMNSTINDIFWWGGNHLVQIGNRKNWRMAGTVFDATTGAVVADLDKKGDLVKHSPDGKIRLLSDHFREEKSFLIQSAFPDKLLDDLKPGDKGAVPVLQAGKAGVGIRS
jgi:hypothetical protein